MIRLLIIWEVELKEQEISIKIVYASSDDYLE